MNETWVESLGIFFTSSHHHHQRSPGMLNQCSTKHPRVSSVSCVERCFSHSQILFCAKLSLNWCPQIQGKLTIGCGYHERTCDYIISIAYLQLDKQNFVKPMRVEIIGNKCFCTIHSISYD